MLVLFLVTCASASAQDCCPRVEVFGGYSYLGSDPEGDRIRSTQFDNRYGANGFGFNVAGNLSHKLGIIGDFNWHEKRLTIQQLFVGGSEVAAARTEISRATALFGPRLTSRSDDTSYFLQAMVGAVRRRVKAEGSLADASTVVSAEDSKWSFAMGFGGGFDIAAAKHIAVRVFQFDYIPTRGETDSTAADKKWSHNYRLQTGIVVRWGLAR
jgi:opacity protein-like surface antigen